MFLKTHRRKGTGLEGGEVQGQPLMRREKLMYPHTDRDDYRAIHQTSET